MYRIVFDTYKGEEGFVPVLGTTSVQFLILQNLQKQEDHLISLATKTDLLVHLKDIAAVQTQQ